MQGAAGLRKNGVGSASGTVSGFRYNARLLAQEIAKRLGHKREWRMLDRDEIVPYLVSELRAGPESCQAIVRMSGQNVDRVPRAGLDLGSAVAKGRRWRTT